MLPVKGKHRFSLTEGRSVANLLLYRETTEMVYSRRTCRLKYYFQNESKCFNGISKHQETNESTRCLDTPMKHEARVLEITSHDHS